MSGSFEDDIESLGGLLVPSPHVRERIHRAGVAVFGFGSRRAVVAVAVERRVQINQVNNSLHARILPSGHYIGAIAVVSRIRLII